MHSVDLEELFIAKTLITMSRDVVQDVVMDGRFYIKGEKETVSYIIVTTNRCMNDLPLNVLPFGFTFST